MAAEAAIQSWLRIMHDAMDVMTTLVGAVATIESADEPENEKYSLLLRSMLPHLRTSHPELLRASTFSGMLPATLACRGTLQSQHTLLVAGFSTLLSALLPQMHNLWARISSAAAAAADCKLRITDEEIFWELWSFLVAGCSALSAAATTLSNLWSEDKRPSHIPLFSNFQALLEWLLRISRSPTWLAMGPQHGLHSRNHELIIILVQATTLLEQVYTAQGPDLSRQLGLLPPSYVPLLCCIVCEQLGASPLLVPTLPPSSSAGTKASSYTVGLNYKYPVPSPYKYRLLRQLSVAVNNFLMLADRSNGYNGPCAFLRSPSVLQFLKVILILPDDSPSARPRMTQYVSDCLHALLTLEVEETQDCPGVPLSSARGAANRDAIGLPIHLDPLLSLAAVETDAQLLHVLSVRAVHGGDGAMALKRQATAIVVIQLWSLAGRFYPVPEAALLVMTRSIRGIAKLCAWQGLQFMKQLRKKSPGHGSQRVEQQLQQQQRASQDAGRLTYARLASLGMDGMRHIREMTFLTSNFQMFNQQGSLDPKAGPAYDTLNAWSAMPGWAAATEVIQRGEQPANDLSEVRNLTLSAHKSHSLIAGTSNASLLRERISLAATVRKLLWPYLQRERHSTVGARRRLPLSEVCEQNGWGEEQRKSFHMTQIVHLMSSVLKGVLALNYVIDDGSSRVSSCSSSSTATSSSSSFLGRATPTASMDGAQGPQSVQPHPSSSAFLLYRLQTISLVTLVQACRWRLECERDSGAAQDQTPHWLVLVFQVCEQLHRRDLELMVRLIMGESARPAGRSQAWVSKAWERHAVTHLHGRLLPGCCNLECDNLQGFSEAMLATQLCSGCKRARYCSIKCQRAAWRKGGHSVVCGK